MATTIDTMITSYSNKDKMWALKVEVCLIHETIHTSYHLIFIDKYDVFQGLKGHNITLMSEVNQLIEFNLKHDKKLNLEKVVYEIR